MLWISPFTLPVPILFSASNTTSLSVPCPAHRASETPLPSCSQADLHRAPELQPHLPTEHPSAFLLYCHADFYGTCRNLITLKTPILS